MSDVRVVRMEHHLAAAARSTRLPAARVRHYVRIGIVTPVDVRGRTIYFGEAELARLRRIRRLEADLGLDAAGVEVVMRLLDEIDALRAALETQVPSSR